MKPTWLSSRRTVAVLAAIAVTLALLAGLVALKAAVRPHWRTSARTGLTSCMRGHWSARSGGSLHRTGHLARCAARLEPARTDYLELAAAGALVALLAGEIGLLVHRRGDDSRSRSPR